MAIGEHGVNGLQERTGALEEGRGGGGGDQARCENSEQNGSSTSNHPMFSVQFVQKLLAEIFGTYFLIFAGCAAVAVNLRTAGTVTFPGICITWGLAVMVMVYSVGHISGAHLNPAVTVAFATCGRFPWKQVLHLATKNSICSSFQIAHRLYRGACLDAGDGRLVKDLAATGRALDQAVIVDDNPNAYSLQPENAVPVAPFVDDVNDQELQRVMGFLDVAVGFDDTREAIRYYKDLVTAS